MPKSADILHTTGCCIYELSLQHLNLLLAAETSLFWARLLAPSGRAELPSLQQV